MRIHINLASQKYEDVRMFVSRASAATAAMALFTLVLAVLAWFNYSSTKSSGAHIRDLQQKINALKQQRDSAVQVENLPENRVVMDENNYWNRQIARRGFSWTQLFNDLQKIMPGRVYVISVAPELTPVRSSLWSAIQPIPSVPFREMFTSHGFQSLRISRM